MTRMQLKKHLKFRLTIVSFAWSKILKNTVHNHQHSYMASPDITFSILDKRENEFKIDPLLKQTTITDEKSDFYVNSLSKKSASKLKTNRSKSITKNSASRRHQVCKIFELKIWICWLKFNKTCLISF